MSKIAMITGSPHNPGTSKQLADAFEKGAREAGNDFYRFDAGLQGATTPHFLQLDNQQTGMEVAQADNDIIQTEVLPHLIQADVVVLVSSLYYFGINAQLKTVIDRFYPYNHELKDKHSVILVSGYGTQDDLSAIKLHMQKLEKYMRWPSLGHVYADDSWNNKKLQQFADQAYKIGRSIK